MSNRPGVKEVFTFDKSEICHVPMPDNVIVHKAFEIDLEKLDEGFLSSPIVCYADHVNMAKLALLRQVRFDNWKLKHSGEELNYLNIPVKRSKWSDKVIFEGKEVVRSEIDGLIRERKRSADLDEILNNPNIKYCYIIKGEYYRPNHRGYTSLRYEAGIYPKEEAVKEARSVREIFLKPVDIEEHNLILNEKIAELQSRLLNH